MKKIELNKMESLQGGGWKEEFCAGFAATAAILIIGAELNFWNPVGWGGGIAIGVVGLGCALS